MPTKPAADAKWPIERLATALAGTAAGAAAGAARAAGAAAGAARAGAFLPLFLAGPPPKPFAAPSRRPLAAENNCGAALSQSVSDEVPAALEEASLPTKPAVDAMWSTEPPAGTSAVGRRLPTSPENAGTSERRWEALGCWAFGILRAK